MKTLREAKDDAARIYLCGVIRDTRGNLTRAAVIAGIDRKHLHKVIRDLAINVRALLGDQPRDCGHGRGGQSAENFTDTVLLNVLQAEGYNVHRTAVLTGVHRSTIYRKIPVQQVRPEPSKYFSSHRGNAAWQSLGS